MPNEYSMDLTKYTLYDFNGEGRTPLIGEYDNNTLAKKMIATWVEYIECDRKCSRSSYCKYVEKDPFNSGRTLEIKCGVATTAIKNFVKHTFYLLKTLDDKKVQNYLDGAYYYYKFIYGTEVSIGSFLNNYYLDSWGDSAAHAFGQIPYIREDLNQLIYHWKDIAELRVEKSIILVEGESEEMFIKTLDCTSLGWFPQMDIRNYGGKGNIGAKRMKSLIDEFQKIGYKIFVEGDADNNNRQNLNTLLNKNIIPRSNLFVFDLDFESSVPGGLLLATLKSLKLDENIDDSSEFIKVVREKDKSIIKILKEKYSIDLEPVKIIFAQKLALIINKNIDCWRNETFMQTELGRFLLFIRKIF
jgi:hypothetical protein